ncbi:MAG: alpha-L-fucosidase, partial [Acidobacteriota bacterium]
MERPIHYNARMIEQRGVRRSLSAAFVVVAGLSTAGAAAPPSRPPGPAAQETVPAERLAARAWYQDAGFGMFIHWGVYSLLGAGEWVMNNRNIDVQQYEWLASTFDPVKFDAAAWVGLAKTAGMRYITITSRHH